MSLPQEWKEVCNTKALVIGLKRYSFRREYTAAKLQQLGFTNTELVDAFDGFEDNVDDALEKMGVRLYDKLGPGHKGRCYTHFKEWKRMIDENAPYRLFFEDDAIGHLDLPNGLGQKFWDASPKDFDLLYLGSMMDSGAPVVNNPNNLVVKVPTYCTHAYILTQKGAQKLWALLKESAEKGLHLNALDIQLFIWQVQDKLNWYCWNGLWTPRSYPTFDEGLPWQMFPDVITPKKDTGLFWQNMRVGTTLAHHTLEITIPQYG